MIAGYILFETIPVLELSWLSIIIGAGVYIYFKKKVRGQMIATNTQIDMNKNYIPTIDVSSLLDNELKSKSINTIKKN